jgi:hypothetical protein
MSGLQLGLSPSIRFIRFNRHGCELLKRIKIRGGIVNHPRGFADVKVRRESIVATRCSCRLNFQTPQPPRNPWSSDQSLKNCDFEFFDPTGNIHQSKAEVIFKSTV